MGSPTSEDERGPVEGTTTVVVGTGVAGGDEPVIAEASPEALPHPAEPIHHPEREDIELAAVLHALSDPVRLQVVGALADGTEVNCKSFALPVSKSTCTHHFRVLREAGVIRQRVEGTTRLNSLRRDDLESRFPGLVDAVLGAAGASR